MSRKGIILAGGSGSRLYPSTIAVSKQLMPIYDKPMIYYPLSVLMQAGIRDILVITTPEHRSAFEKLLGDGTDWGIHIQFAEQPKPEGLAQALIIGEAFLDSSPCALILGDNLFFGRGFDVALRDSLKPAEGATIFGYHVKNPARYGVVEFDADGNAISLQEKPGIPPSNYAVTGLYLYDEQAPQYAKTITKSDRDEFEITALNEIYLKKGLLTVKRLDRSTTWLDTGTHRSLLQAAEFVSVLEERQGRRICCPEEIAFRQGWISEEAFTALGYQLKNSRYGAYLLGLVGIQVEIKR